MTAQKESGLLGGSIAGAQAALGIAPTYPLLLPKWRSALAKVRSGTSNARLLCLGDSTTLGVWSAGGLTTGDMKPKAYPTLLANMFNASGTNAHTNSFFGAGSANLSGPSNAVNDSRVVIGNAWTAHTQPTLGGAYLKASANTNSIAFTPTVNTDTCNLFYVQQTGVGFGKMNMKIGAGTATVFDQNSGSATIGLATGTVNGSLAANTYNVTWDSVATAYFTGMEAYDSSKKWVSVMNTGRSGAKASDLAAPGVISTFAGINADLHIIMCGINDWVNAVSLSSFQSNLQTVITAAAAVGDVVLVTPFPNLQGAAPAPSVQDGYYSVVLSLAVSNNLPVIDLYGRWVSYAVSNPYGLYGDANHPNAVGYADTAQAIFNAIGRV